MLDEVVSSQSVSRAYGRVILSLRLVYSAGLLKSICPEIAMSEEDRPEGGAVVLMPRQNRPLLNPEPFARDSHWDDADVNGWDDPAKLLWIRVRPTGRALTEWKQLPELSKASYEVVKNVLRKRFEPESKQAYMLSSGEKASQV